MKPFQPDPNLRFSHQLAHVRETIELAPGRISLRELITVFGPKGHLLLSLFFVLPFLQPVPIPGLSCILGICIAFFGFYMAIDRAPWVPARVGRIEVEKKFLLTVMRALESLLKKFEHIVKPRWSTIFETRKMRAFHGLMLAWHAFLLALPLPIPFSNMIPAYCLVFITLGSLEEDFAVAVGGYLLALVNLAFFGALLFAPVWLHSLWT